MQLVLQANPKPKYSGVGREWPSYARGWDRYISTIKELYRGPVGDEIFITLLKASLDQPSALEVTLMRERNAHLSYVECWQALCRTHGCDVTFQNRKVWQSVKLVQKHKRLRIC